MIVNDAASLNVTDLVILAGRPAIASVVPIVSDPGEIEQVAGTEPSVPVTVRFLDGSFLDAVMQQYLIEGARFSWDDNAASGEATIPLADDAGRAIGYFVWQPDRPGWRLLSRMAPFLLGALLIVALIIALLVLRLKRASTELLASEAQAQHLAFHDPLTGLADRALLTTGWKLLVRPRHPSVARQRDRVASGPTARQPECRSGDRPQLRRRRARLPVGSPPRRSLQL